jgi:hypothetical protein
MKKTSVKRRKKDSEVAVLSLKKAIHELFDLAEYSYIEQGLWDWLKATVCGDFHVSFDEREKAFLFMMYERLGNLVKAAHCQNEQINGMKKERRG